MDGSIGETQDAERAAPSGAGEARARLAEALGRVARGDREALKFVYARTSAKLFGVCLRILPDRGDAEDALQEAFVTIWRKAGSFDAARGSPITWLVTVTRNRALDRFRSRRSVATQPIEAAGEVADESETADAAIERDQDAAQLRGCLAELSAPEADLIRAAFLQGSTYSELAARADMPLGTVKSRIRRALIKLKGCLTQ